MVLFSESSCLGHQLFSVYLTLPPLPFVHSLEAKLK